MRLALASAVLPALLLVGCSDTPSVDEDAPASTQRDALNSAWDKSSTSEQSDLCSEFGADVPTFVANYTSEGGFDYDVVKSFFDGKC